MLIIVSDIHLGDGTCGRSISPAAFRLFSDRLRELAFNASWRADNTYRPIESVDILMLGDILDTLHSALWLDKSPGESGYVRPWTDYHAPEFAVKLQDITRSILKHNEDAIAILKGLTKEGLLTLPPLTRTGQPSRRNGAQVPVTVNLHYMAGNHDWYYHLPGPAFDAIRQEIVDAFGLANSSKPFPHELHESEVLSDLLSGYHVYAQHGDMYDAFNFDKARGRNAASLGDALAVEILNRFPIRLKQHMGRELRAGIIDSLSELVNVRPVLATPLWISSQLHQNNISRTEQEKLKNLWDQMCNELLDLPFVRELNKPFKPDLVDALNMAFKVTNIFSFKTIDDVVVWARKKFGGDEITFLRHAMKEEAFLDRKAQFVVYGHTHHHEVVPLDTFPGTPRPTNQMYLNSGTWHTYFDLAVYKPKEQKFIPYQVLTYLTFYKDDQRRGRRFESWSGSFSD